tara:strand:+ start:1658 stop:1918 length:261 start_codon:yes stop_codon:yes gene_type:complete
LSTLDLVPFQSKIWSYTLSGFVGILPSTVLANGSGLTSPLTLNTATLFFDFEFALLNFCLPRFLGFHIFSLLLVLPLFFTAISLAI